MHTVVTAPDVQKVGILASPIHSHSGPHYNKEINIDHQTIACDDETTHTTCVAGSRHICCGYSWQSCFKLRCFNVVNVKTTSSKLLRANEGGSYTPLPILSQGRFEEPVRSR